MVETYLAIHSILGTNESYLKTYSGKKPYLPYFYRDISL
ncbi:MAG: hypothetical protein SRB2_00879 [Desulfobacteraceae bacterium Eth-SRB2]|nr:MAG: hypothetical protein SRB2_00879 [Desulfobacteraceae bacterium Eth-SRB2]